MLRYSIPLTILSCALILILTLLSRLLIPLIAKNRKRWSKWRKIWRPFWRRSIRLGIHAQRSGSRFYDKAHGSISLCLEAIRTAFYALGHSLRFYHCAFAIEPHAWADLSDWRAFHCIGCHERRYDFRFYALFLTPSGCNRSFTVNSEKSTVARVSENRVMEVLQLPDEKSTPYYGSLGKLIFEGCFLWDKRENHSQASVIICQ